MASGSAAMLRRATQDCSCQASAEDFEQCAEFPLLRNRGPGPLAMTVLPISLAKRAAATACAAVQSDSVPPDPKPTRTARYEWGHDMPVYIYTTVGSLICDGTPPIYF